MASSRQAALQAINSAQHVLNRFDFQENVLKDMFGKHVFNEEVQRELLGVRPVQGPQLLLEALPEAGVEGQTQERVPRGHPRGGQRRPHAH